jgi:hypothetical protein
LPQLDWPAAETVLAARGRCAETGWVVFYGFSAHVQAADILQKLLSKQRSNRQGDTVWVRVADVLVRNPELPPYAAVIGWLPLLSVEVVNVACPAELRVAVPSVLFLSLKVMVPVGSPKPGALAVTVAVKVTACPCREGLSEEVTVCRLTASPLF